ncbi:MAG: asparagine synthase (glutamine-hydrolyzing) [Kangiellaceae bacterium]|nr:asparagine synthase (glutamine-hydrolyzing) [Kangiellaceae bacterium]
MCGIVVKYSSRSQVFNSDLESAVSSLKHRGPDNSGIWQSADHTVAMGHTRLAIRGISSGSQPIVDECAQLSLVVNGELYNYQKLKTDLTIKGHNFKTNSDSELVIHLYKEYGLEFTDYLRGEFALVLWDGKRQRLIAVRDRFGIKPLVYTTSNGEISLASESKALFALGYQPKWDEKSVLHSFAHQYLPAARTLFANIYQLPPGHRLCYHNNKLDIQPYWQAPLSSTNSHIKDCSEYIGRLLEESIEQRLESEVPIAFSLSGGIDSSLVVAIAAEKMSAKPTCFNISFFDKQYDESANARKFCSSIGAEFHEIAVSADDLVQYCGSAAYHSEGLGINGQYVGKYLLSKAVNAAGFKVMLSGEGADEAFLGYAHLQHDYYLHHDLPGASNYLNRLNGSFPLQSGLMMSSDPTTSQNLNTYMPAFLNTKMNMTEKLLTLLREPYSDGSFRKNSIGNLLAKFEKNSLYCRASPVEKSALLWTELAMGGYILKTLGDGMEMAHSVEGRLPFLDHHLFEAARKLPLDEKIVGMQSKQALRLFATKYLSSEIAKRKKHPFLAPPLIASLSKKGREIVYDLLDPGVLKLNPFLEPHKIRKWLDNIFRAQSKQQTVADPCLMMLLSMGSLQHEFSITDYS